VLDPEVPSKGLRDGDGVQLMPSVSLSPDEVRAAYNRLHARGAIQSMPGHQARLLRLLCPRVGCRLLDVGCGTGDMLVAAAEAGLRAAGVDVSDIGVEAARRRVPEAEVVVSAAEELPFPDAAFDYVTCMGSLEHFAEPDRGLAEMIRVTKPDGRVLILVPNSRHYWMPVLRLVRALFPGLSQPVERHASRQEWERLFGGQGLKVMSAHKDNDWYVRGRLLQSLVRALGRVTPAAISYSLVFVCRPRAREGAGPAD
jgi:SAM-dependent methyltransferase